MYTLYPNILKARARLRSHLEVIVFWTMLDALQFWGGILNPDYPSGCLWCVYDINIYLQLSTDFDQCHSVYLTCTWCHLVAVSMLTAWSRHRARSGKNEKQETTALTSITNGITFTTNRNSAIIWLVKLWLKTLSYYVTLWAWWILHHSGKAAWAD